MATPGKLQDLDRRATDSNSLDIDVQLLTLAYRNLTPMLLVNLAAATGATLVMFNEGLQSVLYWYIAVLILTAVRLWNWSRFNTAQKNRLVSNATQYRYWRRRYSAGLYAAAYFWIAIFYVCVNYGGLNGKYTLSIIISALAGGATGITAPLKYEGRIYISLLLFSSALILALASESNLILAILCTIFLAAMIISHKNNHNVLRQSLALHRENSQLIADLQNVNSSLERRVSKRTEALRRLANHDTLTGLSNRRDILEWMEKNLSESKVGEAAVLFLDLDRFKQINDAMGHDVGDQVLQTIAIRFKDALPENAILGRWGGDEFILITQQAADSRQHAETFAKTLIEIATAPLLMNSEKLGLGLSVGVAYYPTDANNYKDVIQAADLSVAEVKRSERGKVLMYSESYAETQKRRFDLSRALADAIASNKLYLVYQPIVATQTGRVTSLEALSRWNHPMLGVIDPEEFIRIAEDSDRIVALGDWVLQTACAEARSWGARDHSQKIAVNVSIKQLLLVNFPTRIAEILTLTDLPANRLQLEVTESLFNEENFETTLRTVKGLRALGVEIHIDDFGTGYSSLSRLHQFPVNTIKIDRTFVQTVHEKTSVIIESSVMIAKRMDLKVIAEGVETIEQAQALIKIGVDYLQGFYLAQPHVLARTESFEPLWNTL